MVENKVKVQRVEVRVGKDEYSLTCGMVHALREAQEKGCVRSGPSARSLLQYGLLRPTKINDTETYTGSGYMPGVRMDDQVMCVIGDGDTMSWMKDGEGGYAWYTATEFAVTQRGGDVLRVIDESEVPI